MSYYFLSDDLYFPPLRRATKEGILAIGGDLSIQRLLLAYRSGIFPWFSDDEPIIWWAPDPRFVLFPEKLRVSHSMRSVFKKNVFRVTYDHNFLKVIIACQRTRRHGQAGTWITDDVIEAYYNLHQEGYAHSVEVWQEEKIVGGLYGVSLGTCFFGESMFAHVSNASKTGFITLVQDLSKRRFSLIDCQVHTEHLESLGAEHISRENFTKQLSDCLDHPTLRGNWGEIFQRK